MGNIGPTAAALRGAAGRHRLRPRPPRRATAAAVDRASSAPRPRPTVSIVLDRGARRTDEPNRGTRCGGRARGLVGATSAVGAEPLVGEIVGCARSASTNRTAAAALHRRRLVRRRNTADLLAADRARTDRRARRRRAASASAASTPTAAARPPRRQNRQTRFVQAVVSCWGEVVAGTQGVRAEHARIDALWLSAEASRSGCARRIARTYPTARHVRRRRRDARRAPADRAAVLRAARARRAVARRVGLAGGRGGVLTLGLLPLDVAARGPCAAGRCGWRPRSAGRAQRSPWLALPTCAAGHVSATLVMAGAGLAGRADVRRSAAGCCACRCCAARSSPAAATCSRCGRGYFPVVHDPARTAVLRRAAVADAAAALEIARMTSAPRRHPTPARDRRRRHHPHRPARRPARSSPRRCPACAAPASACGCRSARATRRPPLAGTSHFLEHLLFKGTDDALARSTSPARWTRSAASSTRSPRRSTPASTRPCSTVTCRWPSTSSADVVLQRDGHRAGRRHRAQRRARRDRDARRRPRRPRPRRVRRRRCSATPRSAGPILGTEESIRRADPRAGARLLPPPLPARRRWSCRSPATSTTRDVVAAGAPRVRRPARRRRRAGDAAARAPTPPTRRRARSRWSATTPSRPTSCSACTGCRATTRAGSRSACCPPRSAAG